MTNNTLAVHCPILPSDGTVPWGRGGVLCTNEDMGMCRKHGLQNQPFGIFMTPYFLFFFGISMGCIFADFC